MAKTTTEKGLIDPTVPAEGFLGIYATDDGFVQLVSHHEGVKRIIEFTPEEWNQVAVGGIQLGVIARSAAQAKKVMVEPVNIPPEVAKMIASSNGRS